MPIFNTEWRNDSAADGASPGLNQQVVGLSPALGAPLQQVSGGAAMRLHYCGATECQAAVVPPSPVVQSPRGTQARQLARPVMNSAFSSGGCAQLRTKRATGHPVLVREFQRVVWVLSCVPLNVSHVGARALAVAFFMFNFCRVFHDKNFCRFQSHNATQQI
jgi:hypothetical protein